MELDEKILLELDLNSLLVLLMVYREESVTKAASRLGVTQPAVSNTLAKLRMRFGDPLFFSHSRKLHATERTEPMLAELLATFIDLQTVLRTYLACKPDPSDHKS